MMVEIFAWLVGSLLAGFETDAPRVRTDRGVYDPLPVTLPQAGGVFVDPVFGTQIMRVTDEADGPENQNAYSYWPSFNKNATWFHINCSGTAVLYRFDPEGFALLGKAPLFSRNPPGGHVPRWESAIWSGEVPDVLFCHEGLRLWAYDVRSREYTLVKDFAGELPPGHLAQMSKSLDDNVFGFSRQDPNWRVVGYLVWRRSDDKIILREETTIVDEVQVDKTGQYCVIKTTLQGRGAVQARVADLRTGTIEDLIDNEPDFAPGHSDNGRGTIIGADNWRNCLTFRRLQSPHQFSTILDLYNDWSQDYHVSLLADNEDWVLLSFYVANDLPQSGVFRNEIVQAATDGSQRVRRLAHHRSVFARQYWNSPRANISRDGRFVIFTSNWEGRGQRDVFILQVPQIQ